MGQVLLVFDCDKKKQQPINVLKKDEEWRHQNWSTLPNLENIKFTPEIASMQLFVHLGGYIFYSGPVFTYFLNSTSSIVVLQEGWPNWQFSS